MNYLIIFFLTLTGLSADGFLQNLTDKYFEQGEYEQKEVIHPNSPSTPKVSNPTIKMPKPPTAPNQELKETSSSSSTSLQDFTDRLFSQGNYKKDEKIEIDKRDSNTTLFQNFVDKMLKQNNYKEK